MSVLGGTVQIKRFGQTYIGNYSVRDGMVTVEFRDVPSQMARNSGDVKGTALMLLRDMVDVHLAGQSAIRS